MLLHSYTPLPVEHKFFKCMKVQLCNMPIAKTYNTPKTAFVNTITVKACQRRNGFSMILFYFLNKSDNMKKPSVNTWQHEFGQILGKNTYRYFIKCTELQGCIFVYRGSHVFTVITILYHFHLLHAGYISQPGLHFCHIWHLTKYRRNKWRLGIPSGVSHHWILGFTQNFIYVKIYHSHHLEKDSCK